MITDSILQYIPQRTPFVMIGALIEATGEYTKTSFAITEENVLMRDGYFSESGLVENMAQTAAAGAGYTILKDGKEAPVGFIGAIKSLKIIALPNVGDTIETIVTLRGQVMNALIADASVFLNEKQIASCELKIFIQK